MSELKVNGVKLYYELHGSGEPLALVHGSWADATAWRLVVPGLAERFRVLTYDRRGHARSERPDARGSFDEDGEDLAALLERTAIAIKEAMRLYPPAYALGRLAESEQEIGGYLIPAGSYVVVSQFATHRHPQFWDHAEAFHPTRFTPERETARHPHAYFPFGGGPRACIGSQFAMLEAIIAVALLLQRFQIRSEQERVPLDTEGITLRPKGVVPIQPAAR